MAGSPRVTVLLPAYNAAAWLPAAVDSVLRQSFVDFELLVMDDGSTDDTARILAGYSDPRIKVVGQQNRGLVSVLNHGIELARGEFIARMDADDISHPRRLERQASFLEAHPDVGVCGTWFQTIGGGRPIRARPPVEHDEIAATLFFRSAFGHPTVMMRRSMLLDIGLRYDASARYAEDYDLWVRTRPHTRFANLPSYLLSYRSHPDQASAEHLDAQLGAANRIRLSQLKLLYRSASDSEKLLHLRTCDFESFSSEAQLCEARSWLDLLQDANRKEGLFPSPAFNLALDATWSHCCDRARFATQDVLRIFASRRYSGFGFEVLRRHVALGVRALRRSLAL